MATLKGWVLSKVVGDGTPGTNPYRPVLSDSWPEIEWTDILYAQPPYVPAVAISRTISDDVTLTAIHTAPTSMILAAEEWDEINEEWIDYLANGTNWGPDAPIVAWRWSQIRNGLVNLGMDAQTIDDWKVANPNATPTDFYQALKVFLNSQG